MAWLLNIVAVIVGFVGMEAFAWATHRYVMHGFGWAWHRSHHEPRRGPVELNDLFAFVFAGMAVVLFAAGAIEGLRPLWWAGVGATLYGVIYAVFHDGLVHGRFGAWREPRSAYLRGLVQAHKLHHAASDRDEAVSFGFLIPADVPRLAAQFRAKRAAGSARAEA